MKQFTFKESPLQNIVFCIVVLIAAVLLFFAFFPKGAGHTATVSLPNGQQQTIDLSQNAAFDIPAGKYTVHLVVKDGSIRFVNSECPDHICEGYGWLSQADQTAACLPAGVSVIVNG